MDLWESGREKALEQSLRIHHKVAGRPMNSVTECDRGSQKRCLLSPLKGWSPVFPSPMQMLTARVLCSMGKTALQMIVTAEPAGSGLQELSGSPDAATGDPVSPDCWRCTLQIYARLERSSREYHAPLRTPAGSPSLIDAFLRSEEVPTSEIQGNHFQNVMTCWQTDICLHAGWLLGSCVFGLEKEALSLFKIATSLD